MRNEIAASRPSGRSQIFSLEVRFPLVSNVFPLVICSLPTGNGALKASLHGII